MHLLDALLLPVLIRAADFMSPGLTKAQLQEKLATANASLVIDVRKPIEFGIAHIRGAKNIPLDEVEAQIDAFRSDNGVLIYYINGARTRQAEPFLFNNDIDNSIISRD